tara:strand:- start:41 stop:1135 length:1095 start_codon:yes stop_codon:yes gene_type:complete
MSYKFEQFYQCGNEKFHNIFKAFEHQKQTGHFPKYFIDEELVQNISNRKKPKDISPKAIRKLIVNRLKDLRNKYNKLKIAYSGGTDSYTILKLCIDNDIYVDETITIMSSLYGNVRVDLEYLSGIKLAKKYEGTYIGKCVEVRPTINDIQHVNDPEWFFDERFVRGAYLPIRPYWLADRIDKEVADGDTVVLTGYECPKFIIENGIPNWYVDDKCTADLMGVENTVHVFLDKHNPDLVVSLAYASLPFMHGLKEGQYFSHDFCDRKTKMKMLEAYGLEKSPNNFVNVATLGKKKYNYNTKAKYFLKELDTNGHSDYRLKYFNTHKRIVDLYGNLPHALNTDGVWMDPVGRLSQKIPILQDKFAS